MSKIFKEPEKRHLWIASVVFFVLSWILMIYAHKMMLWNKNYPALKIL